MKRTALICALVLMASGPVIAAGSLPHQLPTVLDPALGEDFDVKIRASHTWGVIPFDLLFTGVITGDSDAVLGMAWDFESDGKVDASGVQAYHTFEQAVDYQVTLQVQTLQRGTLTRTITVSGYYALASLTFDDGHITTYGEAFPMMEGKGVTGTAYIVPTWIGNTEYMSWAQVQQLYSAGWEIGSHSMTHPKLTQVDDSTLHWELSQSQIELQSRGFPAKHFGTPHSAYNDHVIEAIRLYYESNHIGDGLNPRVEDSDPYRLLTFTSQPWKAITTYQSHIDSVISTGGWYILLNHIIAPDCLNASWCINTQMLSDIIDYARANRVKIVTVDEALGSILGSNAGIAAGSPVGPRPQLSIRAVDNGLASSHGDLRVDYDLPAPTHLDVAVYDVQGRQVRNLLGGILAAGEHTVLWRGDDESGEPVGSGT
jgi:peptidoglycan/xylan/chitin deacetylase (PgdA/CDA1 family)